MIVSKARVAIVGGGAAGFFAALSCAEEGAGKRITILEKTSQVLQKVRISGGGRCNVTHACFDPRELSANYPRGESELLGPYHQFQAEDTVQWFESRGVKLKTEADGRMFPITDTSETVIECLLREAAQRGIEVRTNCGVKTAVRREGIFSLALGTGETLECDSVLLATGGCRSAMLGELAVSLGHTLRAPVPSLFTFHIETSWVRELSGASVPDVELAVSDVRLKSRGPLLFTHWGLSGPAVLRLSAWGARALHEKEYRFPLTINWMAGRAVERIRAELVEHAQKNGGKLVVNAPLPALSQRIWRALTLVGGIPQDRRWSALTRGEQQKLVETLGGTVLNVTGKSLNKDEFVTCGGVALEEVHFKTMESKICPGLYFAGELLDIDGITGGFNFQAAWTTGWIAGRNMARR